MTFALILFMVLHARKQSRGYKIKLFFLINSLFFLTALVSWQSISRKFAFTFGGSAGGIREDRLLIWRDSFTIIKDFFLTGSGAGTFIDIFPGYKTLHDFLLYEHAHNDFVELFTCGGFIGFILASWFVLSVLTTGLRMAASRRDQYAVLLATASFSGISGLLFFGLTDFNLQNGANGLYFFFFCGLLISAGCTRKHFQTRPTLLPPASGKNRISGFLLSAVFMAVLLLVHGGSIWATSQFQQADIISSAMMRTEKKVAVMIPLLEQAIKVDPLNGKYSFALANIERYSPQYRRRVPYHYIQAAVAQPMDGAYLQAIGRSLPATELVQAKVLLEQGYRRGDQEFERFKRWMLFLLESGMREEANKIMTAELPRYPALLKTVLPILLSSSYTVEEIADLIPARTSAWITCSQLLKKMDKQKESVFFLEHALDYIDQEPVIKPQYFTLVYRHYLKQKQADKAITTVRTAIKWLPDHANFHIQLGDHYTQKGIYYRAREEYLQAQIIDPKNKTSINRLNRLRKKEKE
jgi:tetratricopeptide (TPR) repeat protein